MKRFAWRHREHTILLSRERVNRVKKGTNSSPVVISIILRDFTWKAAAYKSCVPAYKSALSKKFLWF